MNYNLELEILNLPKLRDICTKFLTHNKKIKHLTLPDFKKIYIESYRDIYKLKIKSIVRGNFVTKSINKIFKRRDNLLEVITKNKRKYSCRFRKDYHKIIFFIFRQNIANLCSVWYNIYN